ncbi:MAG: putative N-formylglutamate amidohydrolase [Pseudohongiellaceae bacterium]
MSLTETEPESHLEPLADTAQYPLIGSGDPPPFTVYNAQGKAPVLLVCDHASKAFPAAMYQLGLADWVLDKHVACDIGAELITKHLADQLDAPAVLAGYSRLVMDLNRQLSHESALIKVSDGISIPGNQNVSALEREQRIDSFFNPYHDEISRQIKLFEARDIVPAFISIHTCTPVFNNVIRHCQIGVMWDSDPRIPVPLMKSLKMNPDLRVGDNEPYSGRHPHDFTIDYHAQETGLAHVGIEVRQDLVSTEEGAQQWAEILAKSFDEVLKDGAIYVHA